MTKVSYRVGTFNTISYAEARYYSAKTGLPITTVYTPVAERTEVSAETRIKQYNTIMGREVATA